MLLFLFLLGTWQALDSAFCYIWPRPIRRKRKKGTKSTHYCTLHDKWVVLLRDLFKGGPSIDDDETLSCSIDVIFIFPPLLKLLVLLVSIGLGPPLPHISSSPMKSSLLLLSSHPPNDAIFAGRLIHLGIGLSTKARHKASDQ